MYIPNSSFSLSKTKFMSYLDMKPHNRKLLQDDQDGLSPPSTYSNSRDPLNQSISGSIPFDSSMVLTILVLFTALFFMAFFSIYIRRFADNSALDGLSRRHRRRLLQPPRQSYPPPSSRFNSQKGLDPSTVRSLPLVSYGGATEYPIDCVICLSEFEERETVKLIPYCRHVFHPTCIDTWLASHSSCPLCRSSQMFDSITTTVSEEICLGVERSNISDGVSDVSGRSTVADVDTCPEVGMRRTRIGPFEETCLGVELLSDLEGRSTVVDVDTCHEVGVTITRRRSNSWSSLGDHTVLQRSVSM